MMDSSAVFWQEKSSIKEGVSCMLRKFAASRRVLSFLMVVLFACTIAGCSQMDSLVSGVTATGEFPVEVNGVTISARPQRVVVLSPSLADVVLALNCETQLAGASDGCTQSGLEELQKVSADDVAAVQDLQPDLVLVDSSSNGVQSALEDAGVKVLSVDPATDREDFERLYSQVSSALLGGGSGYDAGIKAAQDIFITLDNINRIVPTDKVTTACYLYNLDNSAVTGDMFASTVMSYAGVTNIFDSLEGGTYDFDSLRIANPNVIFCAPGLKEEIENDSRFSDFQAVKNGKVVELDKSLMEWQGRTVIETAYEISAAAFPELLEENSMKVKDPTKDIEDQVSSTMSAQEQYETLEEGAQGDAVMALQERLTELGYLTEAYDGHYGATTANCISNFQVANGLEATGIADPSTQAALFAKGALRADGTPLPEEADAASESSSSSSEDGSSASSDTGSSSSSSESSTSSSSSSSQSSTSSSSSSESSVAA